MTPWDTIARLAGPGPNKRAVAIQNASSMPIVASTDVNVRRYQPAASARTAMVSHPNGCGVLTESNIACASTNAPMHTTTPRYSRRTGDDGGAAGSLMNALAREWLSRHNRSLKSSEDSCVPKQQEHSQRSLRLLNDV